MTKNQIDEIQKTIGYEFKNEDLLIQAFTRRSFAEENECEDNEVLEFIGDKVLDLVVVKFLIEQYAGEASEYEGFDDDEPDEFLSDYDEGDLSEMKSELVQKKMLAHRIELLGLEDYLRMGKGDRSKHVERQESVKEDLFEAIIGAVTVDCGWDMSKLEAVVEKMLDPEAEHVNEDSDYVNYIGLLQDWSLKNYNQLPIYRVTRDSLPGTLPGAIPTQKVYINGGFWDVPYEKYTCDLNLFCIEKEFWGKGDSEREARREAARKAYEFLENEGYISTIQDEIENPNFDDSISQLEILARRGYFSIPTYDFKEMYDKNGNPVWSCKCNIKEIDYVTKGKSSSKKDAKKQAAFDMLEYVLDEE